MNWYVEQVRAEYDNILQQKLSEQYDAFVKFIDHQIQKRFAESQAPSYLSWWRPAPKWYIQKWLNFTHDDKQPHGQTPLGSDL